MIISSSFRPDVSPKFTVAGWQAGNGVLQRGMPSSAHSRRCGGLSSEPWTAEQRDLHVYGWCALAGRVARMHMHKQ